MKAGLLVFALSLAVIAKTLAQTPTVLISGNGNISTNAQQYGNTQQTTVSKHDQTMEMAQDFMRFCPAVEITLDQTGAPDYFALLNRTGSPTMLGEIGMSQIMILNRRKTVLFVAKTGTVKNAVKHACNAIAADWQAHGRIEPSVAAPQLQTDTANANIGSAAGSSRTLAVLIKPTAAAQVRCKPETISAVLNDVIAYLTAKGITLETTMNAATVLVVVIDRPVSRWLAITVQERDHADNVLWSEKVSDTAFPMHMGTAGLLNTLEKLHKLIDTKMADRYAPTEGTGPTT
ncbi:MAG TPA: hypothetical protein VKU01_14160 [Bryobacteraceae bacterium]|nr:hypothetical protein [Bryobacteraceae bacterium]